MARSFRIFSASSRSHGYTAMITETLCLLLLIGTCATKIAAAADFQTLGGSTMEPPTQELLATPESFTFKGATLAKVATYTITGRILGLHRYYTGRESDTSPFDLALGWGWMSDEKILDQLNFNQEERRLFYQSKNFITRTTDEIAKNTSNNHIIPATDDVADTIDGLRDGEIVTLQGVLVNVSYTDGWHWDTSLSRDDEGDGACEIIYVTQVIVYRDIASLHIKSFGPKESHRAS